MLKHPSPLESPAPAAPIEPPSKPEARPPPTALLTSDDWEMLLGGCEMGNVCEVLGREVNR
jgi:hypothetical protein